MNPEPALFDWPVLPWRIAAAYRIRAAGVAALAALIAPGGRRYELCPVVTPPDRPAFVAPPQQRLYDPATGQTRYRTESWSLTHSESQRIAAQILAQIGGAHGW